MKLPKSEKAKYHIHDPFKLKSERANEKVYNILVVTFSNEQTFWDIQK